MSANTSIDGSAFIVAPLERHEFVVNPCDSYYCGYCHRPRALHRSKDTVCIPSDIDPSSVPIRSPSFSLALRGKILTDKKIDQYAKRGYYSLEFQAARRQLWQNRAAKHASNPTKKHEHFDTLDGRLIYHP